MSRVVVATYTHEWSGIVIDLMRSLRHVRGMYTFIYHQERQNCHKNMAAVVEEAQGTGADFLVLVDTDVVILDEWWLGHLMHPFNASGGEKVGIVGCLEAKTEDQLRHRAFHMPPRGETGEVIPCPVYTDFWIPAYTMAFRLPFEFQVDTEIPGDMGMTDVDLCFQAHKAGKKVVVAQSTTVYHPQKSEEWEQKMAPIQRGWYVHQVRHMVEKWGTEFFERHYRRTA